MCTLVDKTNCIIHEGVMCGPCNPYGVALPVIMVLGVRHYHLMIIVNHENCDSSPMLGAFQRI